MIPDRLAQFVILSAKISKRRDERHGCIFVLRNARDAANDFHKLFIGSWPSIATLNHRIRGTGRRRANAGKLIYFASELSSLGVPNVPSLKKKEEKKKE